MSDRVRVGRETEFETDDRKIVEVNGTEIGVRKVDGDYYAFLNKCPHQGGPVAEGAIQREVVADVPDVGERITERYDEERRVIRCPLHGWAFDIETGVNIADPGNVPGVPTFEVTTEDGVLYIEL